MEFMGKWQLWSQLADGYVSAGYNFWGDTMALGLGAAQPVDMNDAVYHLYSAPKTGEVFMKAQCMWIGSCRPPGFQSPPMWLMCDPSAAQNVSLTLTEDLAKASSFTRQQNGDWFYLLYNSTPIYLNMVFFGVCFAVLGNPFGTSSPNMNIAIMTQSLAFYRQAKSAANADFSHVDFRGVDLSGIDFTGANFNGAYMDAKTVFPAGTVFRNVTFIGANFDDVNFGGCDLSGADFTNTSLAGFRFDTKTKLAGAKFINVDFSNLNFSNFDMPGAVFTGAKLHGFNVEGANLSGAILANLDLTQFAPATYTNPPTLAGSSNQLTNLTHSTIPTALLNNNWQWVDLRNATIPDLPRSITKLQATGAKLPQLNQNVLTGISLKDATLDYALLDGVGLSGADLTGASLIQASLHGTTLTNATLVRAHLTGAQLGSLGQLFSLPSSVESALNAGQMAPLIPLFKNQNINLSGTASIETLAANRVWQLNDEGNHVVYTIRLETRTNGTQLMVYGAALAASLVGAYMPDAVLSSVNFYEVLASSIQFYGNEKGALLDGSAILEEAALNDSNLSTLNLTQAQLMGANLSRAQLFNAKFNKANLAPSASGKATNLSNANLQGADFTDAQLYGADLTNAAIAINVPTKFFPTQGGVYLFSLPYTGDSNTLQQYVAELNAAATQFSLNPKGDEPTLKKYVTALETNDLKTLRIPFILHHITLSESAQIQTIEKCGVWQIVDGQNNYTLWTDIDESGNTELHAAPSLTRIPGAFQHKEFPLRWQASALTDTAGQQWLLDNDSENPKNFSTGYVKFILKLNENVLDIYGTAVRLERMGADNQLQMDTETCNVTTLSVTNMNQDTICPNGTKLSVNQSASGKNWDVKWLRARTPPAPPTCVPTNNSWCPPPQTKAGSTATRKAS